MYGRIVHKAKRKQVGYTINEEMNNELVLLSNETGISKAELTRRALKSYMEDGANDPVVMLNLVMIMQKVNDMKDAIPEESYLQLQEYMGNIMKLKGGK